MKPVSALGFLPDLWGLGSDAAVAFSAQSAPPNHTEARSEDLLPGRSALTHFGRGSPMNRARRRLLSGAFLVIATLAAGVLVFLLAVFAYAVVFGQLGDGPDSPFVTAV